MKINIWPILFTVAIIFFVLLQVKSCKQEQYYTDIISAKNDTVRTWQDEAGRWRAEATTAQVTNRDLQEFFRLEAQQIRNDFDLKIKNVTGYLRATVHTRDTVVLKTDSTTRIIVQNANGSDTAHFHYTDTWSRFDAMLHNSMLTLNYQTRDSVAFATSFKKNGMFGSKRTVLDGISYNPKSKISGITGIEIKAPNYRWSIGPYVGYGWNGDRWAPSVGLSVNYSLIRF